MRHAFTIRIGPVGFRVGSDWRQPVAELERLYADYPAPDDGIPDFTVRLFAARPWRRWLRPSVTLGGDFVLPEAAPLPLAQGLLAAEMAMNLQMALGQRRYLLLHASTVERDGRAVWEALLERSVLVRDCSSWPRLEGCLRVTVGTPAEDDAFLAALAEVLA